MNSPSASLFLIFASFTGSARIAHAQSTISPADGYAHVANAGWLDFRAGVTNGVRVADTALSGYAYAGNFGWLHLGDGTPDNGHSYSNASATDYGVNVSPAGNLTGYAYAANIGWVSFEQVHGQPKLDIRTGKFTGSAYSANLGWISLDTTFSDLLTSTIARPDSDSDGIADAWENLNFGNLTTATATSDKDGDGTSDLVEYNAGTLPGDPTSQLNIVSHAFAADFTQADISFTSVATRNYRLEYDEDLSGPWMNSSLGTFAPTGAVTRILVSLNPVPCRFFRVVAVALPTAP